MLPLLSLHSLAAQRGDGLRPELKALLERHASQATGLVATIEPVEQESLSQATQAAADVPARESGGDESTASVSCFHERGQ
jgi:hypothetical protein